MASKELEEKVAELLFEIGGKILALADECQASGSAKGEPSSEPAVPLQSLTVVEAQRLFQEQRDRMTLEQRAQKIACDNVHNCNGDAHGGNHNSTCIRLTAAISAALLSVQRETREADAKMIETWTSQHEMNQPIASRIGENMARAIRSQGDGSGN